MWSGGRDFGGEVRLIVATESAMGSEGRTAPFVDSSMVEIAGDGVGEDEMCGWDLTRQYISHPIPISIRNATNAVVQPLFMNCVAGDCVGSDCPCGAVTVG